MDFTVERIRREWSKLDESIGPSTGTKYTTWLSPDKKLVAMIHEADDELVSVEDAKTGDLVYAHPRTSKGALVLGLLYSPALAGFCVICGKPKAESRRFLTCSEECHERLVERLVWKFGEFKRVVDAETGKAYRVPTRDIIERGLKHGDLARYPLWDG